MPSLAITFGQAPQAAHRVLSQFATMASRTLTAGCFPGPIFNALSARFTLLRHAFTAPRSIITRNITRTQLTADPSPPEVRALSALPHGKLKLGNGVTRSSAPRSLRQFATPKWAAHFGCMASDSQRRVSA